ncbi:uncharacterized protein LOC134236626 isoform X2 [Saccostrea cucullata]|uniref:uncharacterized protein LOC134236626 isoform X2 n=1 Tax=Saccostrea cuccullata TaxID=36930 RepID=UPI002ED0BB3A
MRRFPGCVALIFLFFGFISLYHMYERILEKGLFSVFEKMQMDSLQCLSNKNRIHLHAPDLSHTKELKLCHKSRIMSIIYENLCQYPFKVVPKIYRFLNIEFTNMTEIYIKRMMNGPIKKCHYCTDRGNALGNAYRWIHAIEEKTLIIIDLYCSFLFPSLGYKHLNYEELNTTFVSWMPT